MVSPRLHEVIAMSSDTPRLRFEQREQGAFYREVRAEAAAYLAKRGGSPHAPAQLKCALLALLAAACYGAVFVEALPQAARLAAYVGFGVAAILLAVNAGHEAAHGALLRSAAGNTLVNRLTFMLVGVDGRMWAKRHLGSHHVYPNILGCDADIDASYLLRLSPHHPHRWYQRWQHLYAPFVYPLVQVHSIFVQDTVYLFKRRLANLSDLRPSPRDVAEFVVVKAGHFAIALVLPAVATDLTLGAVLIAYLAAGAVMSTLFILALIGTHFAEGNRFPAVRDGGTIAGSWAAHSVETSLDWSPCHRLATAIVGGLNAHAAHHLFPQVSHAYYPALTRIIARAAARHGVKYRATTLGGMIAGHFRFLRALAAPPAGGVPVTYIMNAR
jgi:linoleoyl-CoA desaturase